MALRGAVAERGRQVIPTDPTTDHYYADHLHRRDRTLEVNDEEKADLWDDEDEDWVAFDEPIDEFDFDDEDDDHQ